MRKQKRVRLLSILLVLAMALSTFAPVAYAQELDSTNESNFSEEGTSQEKASPTEEGTSQKGTSFAAKTGASEESTTGGTSTGEAPAADYDSFLASLKTLEGYASDYAQAKNEKAADLVLNYIRTGIDKYNDDSWAVLAGAENTAFTAYVAEQDTANGTSAQALRGIDCFTIPNGQKAEFAHMIGVMSIANYNDNAAVSADFGGWAGDLVDLMEYTKGKITAADIEAMAKEIRENYLGVDDPSAHSFGFLDIYADLDAVYLMGQLSSGKSLSGAMEGYFTSSLTDTDRVAYFLTNRFGGKTGREELRGAMLEAYSGNSGVIMLEAERNLTNDKDLRTACCYAFTDYLYELAKDKLGGETGRPYYEVFSREKSTLAPGITQEIKKAITADEKQIVYYIATVDTGREDVSIYANYKDNAGGPPWGMARVTDQMAAARAKHTDLENPEHYIENYTPVVGVNADFYNMTTGCPSGALVMEGTEYHPGYGENFFAILKDGTPMIGTGSEWDTYKGQIQEAVGGANYLVKDGKIAVNTTSDYYNSRASRTCVGITADGKVVLMALDGRQEPFSAGGSAVEIAQIMLDADCETAINLDGGGSTTYAAKEEGSDEVAVVNRPSDGYERSVSSSLMVVSTAKSSTAFDHAMVAADSDYLTVGTSLDITVSGVSASGNTAQIPDGAILRVSDESKATLADNVFTAAALGDVEVELVVGETVVGSKTLHIVAPDALAFTRTTMNAVYGIEAQLPIAAYYQGNPVSVNDTDLQFTLSNESAGTITGFVFTGNEASGVRAVTVTAALKGNPAITAGMQLALYKNGEAIFDFSSAMEGDSSFAWNRDIPNAKTEDNKSYKILDPNKLIDISYVFAIDMQSIQIPEQIKPLIGLLPGGDDPDATAWDFLLQLAERVSVLTEVKIMMQVDPDLIIETSEMTLVNEYFELSSAEFDQGTGLLTVTCRWKDQTAAIDPATANPICILSGVKAFVKNDAQWDENHCLQIANQGEVRYDIYLRSGTLYSVASNPSMQEQYGIYPFINPDDPSETGGHFYETYKTFEDSFTLDNSVRNGWIESGENLYYYADNVPVTGVRYLPGYQDEGKIYYYQFNEDGVCRGKITGLFELNGEAYYAINGELKSDWRLISDTDGKEWYYYFDPETNKGLNGKTNQFYANIEYEFENGKLLNGVWETTNKGSRYYYGPGFVQGKWYTIDENRYYFDSEGYRYEGYRYVKERDNHSDPVYWYDFGEDGICKGIYRHTGLLITDDYTYYVSDGQVFNGLVVAEDGYYYYFSTSNYAAVKNTRYWISYPNDTGITPAFYDFDEYGRMLDPTTKEPINANEAIKNGIVDENGTLYYYVNGVKTYAGLIIIGGDYYYVNSSCKVVTNQRYWISKTNDLLPATFYNFDETGKMADVPVVNPDPEPDPEKNGIVNEDGTLYYYVNGVKTYAGLIIIDGDYYYVNSTCKVVTNQRYWISKTNDLLPATFYNFDETGKMADVPVVNPDPEPDPEKNGIVNEDGTLYYYVNGVKTYAGLIVIDGDYYYVNSTCKVITNQRYWISKTNDLLPATFYNFDETGKMVH